MWKGADLARRKGEHGKVACEPHPRDAVAWFWAWKFEFGRVGLGGEILGFGVRVFGFGIDPVCLAFRRKKCSL